MKKLLFICILASFPVISGMSHTAYQDEKTNPKGTLKVMCTQDLSDLVISIKDRYKSVNGEIDFEVSYVEGNEPGMESLPGDFLFSSYPGYGYSKEGKWSITVGRDILVPVVSKDNPFYEELILQGIDLDEFAKLLKPGKILTWGDLLGTENGQKVSMYFDNAESSIVKLKKFTGDEIRDAGQLDVEYHPILLTRSQLTSTLLVFVD